MFKEFSPRLRIHMIFNAKFKNRHNDQLYLTKYCQVCTGIFQKMTELWCAQAIFQKNRWKGT